MKFGMQLVIAMGMFLSGCASAPLQPKQAPPAGATSASAEVAARLPTDAEKYSATGLKGTYFGVTGAKGSAAVGVLFGVVGVLGNIAHINSENRDSASPLGELTSQNLAQTLAGELGGVASPTTGASAEYELIPSANLYFKDKTTYWLTCTITVRQKATTWQARYAVPSEGVFKSTSKLDTDNAIKSLRPCLKSAYTLFAEHIDGKLAPFDARTVVSPRLDGKGDAHEKFSIATSALPDRVIENDAFGLVQLRKDQIKTIY